MSPTRSRMRAFTLRAQFHGGEQRAFPAHQPAGHFVDRADRGDRKAAFHRFHHPVVILDIELVPALDQHDFRAQAPGVGHDGAGPHAEGLGLVTGGNAAGCVGQHGNDADRFAAQFRPVLLLHGGEVGIEIDEEPVQGRIACRGLGIRRDRAG